MGMTPSRPKFARAYRNLRSEMVEAAREWSEDVASGKFPSEAETFH